MSHRLNAFERYMLADDRDSHPMTFTVRMSCSGHFDEAAFRRALPRAVERHPLLGSCIVGNSRQARWVPAEVAPFVDIADSSTPFHFPHGERIDLRSENGFRIWVRTGMQSTEIRVQFHHSATDGIGAYRFLEDLLCAYDAETHGAGAAACWRPVSVDQLRHRARFGLSRWQVLLRLPLELWGLVVGMITFLLLRPAAVHAPQRAETYPTVPPRLPEWPTHTFSAEETKRLCQAARGQGATLNELLIRDLFVALNHWNTQFGAKRSRLLRIMVPVSLRTLDDAELPAANVVAMVFMDRHLGVYRSAGWLLKSIRWESWLLKKFRFGLAFVRGCGLFGLLRGGLEFMTRGNRCYASAVLSNMGQVLADAPLERSNGRLVAGSLTLESVESAPPVRPFTSIGMSLVTYAGRLAVVMNYDRQRFAPETAQALFSTYLEQIQTAAHISVPASLEARPAVAA